MEERIPIPRRPDFDFSDPHFHPDARDNDHLASDWLAARGLA